MLSVVNWKNESMNAKQYRGHALPVTCIAVACDGRRVVSGAKDTNLICYDLETGCRSWTAKGDRRNGKGEVLRCVIVL